jgi:DnaK suppressor protein
MGPQPRSEGPDFAGLLAEEHARATQRLTELTGDYEGIVAASVDSNADDEHDPEGSTIAFERSQVGALVAQARTHLEEIDAAQQRLREGRFGRCERCGQPIAPERLEARPVARMCISCAGAR